jgi:hypothetical protein
MCGVLPRAPGRLRKAFGRLVAYFSPFSLLCSISSSASAIISFLRDQVFGKLFRSCRYASHICTEAAYSGGSTMPSDGWKGVPLDAGDEVIDVFSEAQTFVIHLRRVVGTVVNNPGGMQDCVC